MLRHRITRLCAVAGVLSLAGAIIAGDAIAPILAVPAAGGAAAGKGVDQARHADASPDGLPRIAGVVRDPNARPLAGVELRPLLGGRFSATSGSQGEFELACDQDQRGPRGMAFWITASHETRNLAAVVEIGPDKQTLDIRLEPAMTLTGKVVDPNGRAIPGAKILPCLDLSAQGGWRPLPTRREVETDERGVFTIVAAPAGWPYQIAAGAEGYGQKSVSVDANALAGARVNLGLLTLPAASLTVSGWVVDVEGRPVAAAGIHASGYGSDQPRGLDVRSDAEGRFRLKGVCSGMIGVEATTTDRNQRGRVLTEGGASGVKIVVSGRELPVRYIRLKSREQIMQSGNRFIAGMVVDSNGVPVADVPVEVRCRKTQEDGKSVWQYEDFGEQADVTDSEGRFVIELREEGEYNLRVLPMRHTAMIVYEVAGRQDVRIVLPEGGTVVGRLVRQEGGKKTPIANAEVVIAQSSRLSFGYLGLHQDRKVVTDAQGRFRVEHLNMETRADEAKAEYSPRLWVVKYGDISEMVSFAEGKETAEVELVVRPSLKDAASLTGRPLPAFDGIKIDLDKTPLKDKRILVCFFDMEQRPSRQAAQRLSSQAASLAEKGVVVLAVDLSKADASVRSQWIADQKIQIPVGLVPGDADEVRVSWSVKALPWLVLADARHVAKAEGFAVGELDAILARWCTRNQGL
jgi:protocatechuate 3,4-dioxygenase beta subunit